MNFFQCKIWNAGEGIQHTHTHINQDEAPQAALADATAGFGGFETNFDPAVGKMTSRETGCSPNRWQATD